MYMYAMFSKQEVPRESYHTYNIFNGFEDLELSHLGYRKYTVLMNTIGQYDDIINNNMLHPETIAIDKFIDRLHLDNTTIKSKLKGSFVFTKPELDKKLGVWIGEKLNINPQDITIEKETFNWDASIPNFKNKVTIYGVD